MKVTDTNSLIATQPLTLTIIYPLGITTTSLSDGVAGIAYSQTLAATGGAVPYTWSLASGSLPTGLTLSSAGVLSGTPSTAGTFSVSVKVTDTISLIATQPLTLTIINPLGITTTTIPNGVAGIAYSQTLAAKGGAVPYTWSLASGSLPTGLTLSSAGVLSGTPTIAGTFSVNVKVTDTNSLIATQPLTITIANPVGITTTTLANGVVGDTYSQTLSAGGGAVPYTWALSAGTLPPGLTLSSTGFLSGTPTTVGSYSSIIKVTDSNQSTATSPTYTIIITGKPDLTATALSTLQTTMIRSSITYQFRATLKNSGLASSPGFTAGFYLSTDNSFTASDLLIGSIAVGALAPGATQSVVLLAVVPASVPPGTYYLGVIADSTSVVVESNELNNELSTTGKVTIR